MRIPTYGLLKKMTSSTEILEAADGAKRPSIVF